jgi:hypothetical protein
VSSGGPELFTAYLSWEDTRRTEADDRLRKKTFGLRMKERFKDIGTRTERYAGIDATNRRRTRTQLRAAMIPMNPRMIAMRNVRMIGRTRAGDRPGRPRIDFQRPAALFRSRGNSSRKTRRSVASSDSRLVLTYSLSAALMSV